MALSGRILLVDDEVAVRSVYQLYLESHGYSVVLASSVAEALRLIKSEPVALVLLDVFLQEENGLEFLKAIVAARLNVKVIVMSGTTDEGVFDEAIKSGAAGVFRKSLRLDTLLKEVERVS